MKRNLLLILLLIYSTYNYSQENFNYTEKEWSDYFTNNIKKLNSIEGIWSLSCNIDIYKDNNIESSKLLQNYSQFAIKSFNNGYMAYFISGDNQFKNIEIKKTAIDNEFIMYLQNPENDKIIYTNAELKENILEFKFELSSENDLEENGIRNTKLNNPGSYLNEWLIQNSSRYKSINSYKWIKLYPASELFPKEEVKITPIPFNGTGFAISERGEIATCYHVIKDADNIKVSGIGGDFSKFYNAKLLISDISNDLAIIQISDSSFRNINEIPYSFKSNTGEVGSEVYLLGYPMRSTMGDELKVTNGIISAKSGYKGDNTNYQISAAVQPGNSGGPLFDKEGDIIGIISSKLTNAENASYALKSEFLIKLIKSLPQNTKTEEKNKLNGKTLPEQIELVKNLVYMIEAY